MKQPYRCERTAKNNKTKSKRNSDEKEDKTLIKKMIKNNALK